MSDRDRELSELGQQLPWDHPDDARRDALRSSLLAAATTGAPRSRARWLAVTGAFAAGVIAAAAVAVVVVRGGGEVDERAQIVASSAADFERTVTRTGGSVDEVVHVHGGKISLSVGKLAAHDRVRVATGDAEVEGEGTYAVSAAGDAIQEVAVDHGSATVRVRGHQPVFLASGETWKATVSVAEVDVKPAQPTASPEPQQPPPAPTIREPTTPAPHEPTPPAPQAIPEPAAAAPTQRAVTETAPEQVAPPSAPTASTEQAAGSSAPAPRAGSPLEQHFQAGWQLLRGGKAAEAARELGVAADAGGDDPLAADARYFQAVALTRAGRKTEAEHALVAFLDHAPHSLRRGRAEVMLARLIAERGDMASATAWFRSALDDPDPEVVGSARAGLAALPH